MGCEILIMFVRDWAQDSSFTNFKLALKMPTLLALVTEKTLFLFEFVL